MAEHHGTPSDTSPTRKRARTLDSSDASSHLLHPDSTRTSQRVRTASKASERQIQIELPPPDVTFERRRVNPESLALRLGPELVSDLDALVPPGSRDMPSFTARKELQERHKVDRRHIYDYYHSKGLRVVKEDKHGNPIKQTEPASVIPQVCRVAIVIIWTDKYVFNIHPVYPSSATPTRPQGSRFCVQLQRYTAKAFQAPMQNQTECNSLQEVRSLNSNYPYAQVSFYARTKSRATFLPPNTNQLSSTAALTLRFSWIFDSKLVVKNSNARAL